MRRRRLVPSRRGRVEDAGTFEAINITPFTDVLLVLLIIFMIAGSALAPTGLGLTSLAVASDGKARGLDEEQLVLEIDADGESRRVRGGQALSWQQLEQLPRATPVLLSVEKAATTQQVVTHFDRMLSLGFRDITWGPPRGHFSDGI